MSEDRKRVQFKFYLTEGKHDELLEIMQALPPGTASEFIRRTLTATLVDFPLMAQRESVPRAARAKPVRGKKVAVEPVPAAPAPKPLASAPAQPVVHERPLPGQDVAVGPREEVVSIPVAIPQAPVAAAAWNPFAEPALTKASEEISGAAPFVGASAFDVPHPHAADKPPAPKPRSSLMDTWEL